MDNERPYRLYGELAGWWPLISPLEEYAADAAELAAALSSQAARPLREVLDLGGGGGHLAAHLKGRFAMTVMDQSAQMLAASRRLNPGCAHVLGDMRTARLGRSFDAVVVHDAASYLVSEQEARQVAATAFAHCRPGGAAVLSPDWTQETFRPGAGSGGGGDRMGRRAVFRERRWDPAAGDGWVRVDYEFTLREKDGSVRVVRESHRLGALPSAAWLRALADAGFDPRARQAAAGEPARDSGRGGPGGQGGPGGTPRAVFVGRRPRGRPAP